MTAVSLRRTKSRWPSQPLNGQSASLPPYDHPALTEGRSIFASTVRGGRNRWALKSGTNSWKIGGQILKGHWKNFPVFTLTLEERKTCPTSCHHWRSCMGNRMNFADRVQADADLHWRLEREVQLLAAEHPDGFAVRLHVLGDFFSTEYVALWARLLEQHPELHVFGFSARHDKGDPIAEALIELVERQWPRFAVRFSNAPFAPATITVEHPLQVPAGTVCCPEQTGRTESCSTCGICWSTKKRVAFLQH
jgi:hypothetical protein